MAIILGSELDVFSHGKMHHIILFYLAGSVLTFAPQPPLSHEHDAAAGKSPSDQLVDNACVSL